MGVGRKAEFDPPLFGQRPVPRHDAREQFADQAEQLAPVVQREITRLGLECAGSAVRGAHRLAEPGEVVPGDEVGEVAAIVEVAPAFRVGVGPARQVDQPAVGREAVDHPARVGASARRDQLVLLVRVGRRRGRRERLQQRIANRGAVGERRVDLARVILELVEQHRREVDHRPGARLGLEVRGHVHVVLDAVQVGPGLAVDAARRVEVLRLVHVPAEHDLERVVVGGQGQGPFRYRFVGLKPDLRRTGWLSSANRALVRRGTFRRGKPVVLEPDPRRNHRARCTSWASISGVTRTTPPGVTSNRRASLS